MTDKPLVLVVGATGHQGGSVARHLLASGRWAVRALTRDPGSLRATALVRLGAEVVRGDLGDPESLRRAARGAAAMFLLTEYWSNGAETEYRHGRAAVDAALAEGVGHIVYSSLPEVRRRSGGTLDVPHYDSKARLESELRAEGAPASFLHPSMYYETWPTRRLRRRPDGSLVCHLPYLDVPLPTVAAADLGGLVLAMLDAGERMHGATVRAVGDRQTPSEYTRILTELLGVPVVYEPMSREEYAQLPVPGARPLAEMFQFIQNYLSNQPGDLEACRALYPGMRDFATWAREHVADFRPLLQAPRKAAFPTAS